MQINELQYIRKYKNSEYSMSKISLCIWDVRSVFARHSVGSKGPPQLLFHKVNTQTTMCRCCFIGLCCFGSNSLPEY